MNDLGLLKGKKIVSCSLSEDKTILTFKTKNSIVKLESWGDCCSQSWIEHHDDIPEGCTITEIIEKNVNVIQKTGWNEEKECYEDHIQQYFYDIVTDKGTFTLEMRNSSNGYYGGYLQVTIVAI